MKNWKALAFLLILATSFIVRVVGLESFPPSISWDEAAVGYNAYSVLTTGRDEWGKLAPLVFKSFRDFKHPVHVYMTLPFVYIFGLNDFAIRLPFALLGVAYVYLMYLFGKQHLKREIYGLVLASVVALSPYAISFSRFNHELVVVMFSFYLALYAFLNGLTNIKWLTASAFFFGLTTITYHSAKVIVPIVLIALCILYFKNLKKFGSKLIQPAAVFGVFVALILFYPGLLGVDRARQSTFSQGAIEATQLYKQTANPMLGTLEVFTNNYLAHFSLRYLFISGDANLRHSTNNVGEFYALDALFLLLGVFGLIKYGHKHRSKEVLIIFLLILTAPIPSALTSEAPHAARAMFMMGSMHIVIAYGIYMVYSYFRNKEVGLAFLLTIFTFYFYFFLGFINYYFTQYPIKSAIEWRYGMKQVVAYVANNQQYSRVFVTKERSQPYIFFLYYLKYPSDKFLETVMYETTPASSFNTVSSFENGKYNFGNWDIIHSTPIDGYLYVLTPSEYSGLYYKNSFVVKEVVRYPDGADAFYIVSSY